MSEADKPRIAILASGGGSTAEAFIHATQNGIVDADVSVVVSNNPPEKAGVYERIRQLNERYGLDIQTAHISSVTHPHGNTERGMTDQESEAVMELVDSYNVALVGLMGYMKVVRGSLLETYGWTEDMKSNYEAAMINTHPGPLPETADTHGLGTSEKVLALGMRASRHTVHLVSVGVDAGPPILETEVPVLAGDTADNLFQRVQLTEKRVLPIAIQQFLIDQAAFFSGK